MSQGKNHSSPAVNPITALITFAAILAVVIPLVIMMTTKAFADDVSVEAPHGSIGIAIPGPR